MMAKDTIEAIKTAVNTEMFPTKVICIKDFRSKGNEVMKDGDSYFTKDRRYNVYVDNRQYKDGTVVQFFVVNDAGLKHIIGNYGDEFFNNHFTVIEEKAFHKMLAKVTGTRKTYKEVWVAF